MTKLFALLLCLLLSGCTFSQEPAPEALTHSAQSEGFLLERYGLPAQILPQQDIQGLVPMGENLLLFSGQNSTTLTLLNSKTLREITSTTLDFSLSPDTPGLQAGSHSLSWFDPETRTLVLLDEHLVEIRRTVLPVDAQGIPLLDPDHLLLYYTTAQGIHLWDLNTGARRRIKEAQVPALTLTALHQQGTILQCTYEEAGTPQTWFLSASDGRLLAEYPGLLSLTVRDDRYFAALPQDFVFCAAAESPRVLLPALPAQDCTYLPDRHTAVTRSDSTLHCYDLATGSLLSTLELDQQHLPLAILSQGENLLLLIQDPTYHCHALLTWPIPASSSSRDYTDLYYTPASPDLDGLAACQAQANALAEAWGISISIWHDAAAKEPWDYAFTESYQPRKIRAALTVLEDCLSQYPPEVLSMTTAHFSSFRICLVDSISGTAASGSLDTATGIQFLDGSDAYLVIADTPYAHQAFHHEFFHLMETHILSNSTALDPWESRNPAGFSYDYSYTANEGRNSGVYLEPAHRAFIDTYSMSYPKEDRARVFEYAMLPGQEELFSAPILQEKLTALCQGIRDAYNLEKSQDVFPWEQYLNQ